MSKPKLSGLFAYDTVNNKLLQCEAKDCTETAFFAFDNGKVLCMEHGRKY